MKATGSHWRGAKEPQVADPCSKMNFVSLYLKGKINFFFKYIFNAISTVEKPIIMLGVLPNIIWVLPSRQNELGIIWLLSVGAALTLISLSPRHAS